MITHLDIPILINGKKTLDCSSSTWDKLINLAVQRGIYVRLVDRLAGRTGVRGVWTVRAGLKLILVDGDLAEYDRNFTMAHELGHDFLHGNKKLVQYRPDGSVDTIPQFENEADQFATRLLKQLDCITCLEDVAA
jgi:Zn-dependent peptidase ImmA (M78 family)